MTIVKDKRAQIVWVLLACILLNVFVCSLNHASHVGFELAMGQDAFCFTDGTSSGGKMPAAGAHDSPEQAFDCPLCSSLLLLGALLLCLGWLGRPARQRLRAADGPLRTPRAHWPSLNPRAP